MNLKQALINQGNDELYVDELIAKMKQRFAEGEDPEEILFDEGLEPDYLFDLIY